MLVVAVHTSACFNGYLLNRSIQRRTQSTTMLFGDAADKDKSIPLAGGARRRRAAFDLDGDGKVDQIELMLAVKLLAAKVATTVVPERAIIIHLDEDALYGEQLWQRWRGTTWEVVWPKLVIFGAYTAAVCAFIHASTPGQQWDFLTVPDSETVPFVRKLEGIERTWGYLSTVTTFTLTFFLNQCYAAWRTTFGLARQMQGRLMDMCLALTSHAQRDEATGQYTPEAAAMLAETTRLARAAHVLHWMSQDAELRLLHDDMGLDALAQQGLLTSEEAELIKVSFPVKPRWQMPLAWLMTKVGSAKEKGLLTGGDAFHLFFLEAAGKLRGNMGSMQDESTDRMPLAYIHLVEVLVDTLLVLAPL